jgi:hypothetical protein
MLRILAIALGIGLVLSVIACAVVVAAALFGWERDPFDRFTVIDEVREPGSGRFAVTYQYHHANSSSDVLATWILAKAPAIGSTEPPPGRADPVLVWTNRTDVMDPKWAEGKLVAKAARHTDRRTGGASDCYFEERPHLVCLDPLVVDLIDNDGQ